MNLLSPIEGENLGKCVMSSPKAASNFADKIQMLQKGIEASSEEAIKIFQTQGFKVADFNKIMEVAKGIYKEIAEALEEQESKLISELKSLKPLNKQEFTALEQKVNELFKSAGDLRALYDSKRGNEIFSSSLISLQNIENKKDSIQKLLSISQILHELLLSKEFKYTWESIGQKSQDAKIDLLLESFNKLAKISDDKKTLHEFLKASLTIFTNLAELIDALKPRINEVFGFIGFYYHNPKCLDMIIECSRMLPKLKIEDKKHLLQAANAIFYQWKSDKVPKEIAKDLDTFYLICFDKKFKPGPDWINESTVDFLPFYREAPKLLERLITRMQKDEYIPDPVEFRKYALKNGSYHVNAMILDLLDHIPDAMYAIDLLFNGTSIENKFFLEDSCRFSSLIMWLNKELENDNSVKNKERISGILDRITALIFDNPSFANVFMRSLTTKEYPLLEVILKDRNDFTTLNEEEVSKILKEVGNDELGFLISYMAKKSLAKKEEESLDFHVAKDNVDVKDDVSKGHKQSIDKSLQESLDGWLDFILQMHNVVANEGEKCSIQQKLQKLPAYAKIVKRMFSIAANDGKVLFEMLTYAKMHPYSENLQKYLDLVAAHVEENPADVKEHGIARLLQSLNVLSKAFPELSLQLLSRGLKNIPVLEGLLKENKPLLQLMIERHPNWLGEKENKMILGDFALQKNILALLEIEKKNDIDLLQHFNNHFDLLKGSPLLSAIIKNPEIGYRIAIPGTYNLGPLNRLLEKQGPEMIEFIKTATQDTFLWLLLAFESGKSVEVIGFTKSKYPQDMGRILLLMQRKEDDLAKDLLSLYKHSEGLAHGLLDMAYAEYIPEVKVLLEKLKAKPVKPLIEKLCSIAGSQNASLISKILALNDIRDKSLLDLFVEGKSSSLFFSLMRLKVRGQERLFKQAIEICETNSEKRSAPARALLQCIEEGRYLLAEELMSKEGMYILDRFKVIPQVSVLQKYSELVRDLAAIDKKTIGAQDSKLLEQSLLPFVEKYAQESKNEKSICSWIGRVQFLLQHRPQKLFKVLAQKNWQEIDKNADWDISEDVNATMELLLKQEKDVKEAAEKEFDQKHTKLTLAFAHCLMTPSGSMNTEIIDLLKNQAAYKRISGLPYAGDYIKRILDTFKEDLDFNERLGLLKEIPKLSRQEKLLSRMLQLPEGRLVDPRLAKVAIISALLWPLRQSETGSCFATSCVIQLSSYPDGLKQILEDLLSFLINGYLQRPSTTLNVGIVQYPLMIEKEVEKFSGDNLLARAYEYSLASLGGAGTNDHGSGEINPYGTPSKVLHEKWGSTFLTLIEEKVEKVHAATMHLVLMKQLKKSSLLIFDFFEEHPDKKEKGAWKLLDRETGEPLHNPGVLKIFYKKVLEATKQTLLKNPDYNKEKILEIFEIHFPANLDSRLFNDVFFETDKRLDFKGLARVNPPKYRPIDFFVSYRGGNAISVIATLHSSKIAHRFGASEKNPFESMYTNIQMLSDDEFMLARKNPLFLKNVSSSEHEFNFKAGEAVALFQKESPSDLWSKQQKLLSEVENTQLTPEISDQIVKAFIEDAEKKLEPQLKFALNAKLKECKTIRELCDALFVIQREVCGIKFSKGLADVVENAVRSLPMFKGKFPVIHSLYDTNYLRRTAFGYSQRIYDRCVYISYPTSENLIRTDIDWNPGQAKDLMLYHYGHRTSDLSRSYCLL